MGELMNIFHKMKAKSVDVKEFLKPIDLDIEEFETDIFQCEDPKPCYGCGSPNFNGGSVCSDDCFETWEARNRVK